MPPRPLPGAQPAISTDALRRRADISVARQPMDAVCKRLLAEIRDRCPNLLPADPVPPSTLVDPITLDPDAALRVVRLGIAVAAGLAADDSTTRTVLWRKGDLQLLVHVADVKTRFAEGTVDVILPVACDEEQGTVVVTFAVGGPKRVTGLLAATEERPQGPPAIVGLWADELIALAWHGLLEGVAGLAGAVGRDLDDAVLVPAGLNVSATAFIVQPMARHEFDRTR